MLDRNQDDIIPPTSRLFWVGHHFRIRASYTDRYDLECTDGYELFRTLPREQVRVLVDCGDLEIDPHYFDLEGKPAGATNRVRLLADRPVSEQRRAMVSYVMARELNRDYRAGKVRLYETRKPRGASEGRKRRTRQTGAVTLDVWLHRNTARLYDLCRPFFLLDKNAPQALERPRKGQPGPPSLGSPSSLKKAHQKFCEKSFRITDLLPDVEGMTRGGRHMAPDMAAICEKRIRSLLLRPERPTVALLRRQIGAELNAIPEMKHRSVPAPGTIENLILTLNDAQAIGAIFGIEKMEQKSVIRTKGPQFTRVGEKIIMDCWKIDQVTLVKHGEGWMLVNKELEEEWGVRRRLWVAMAIDACSRVVVGMALGYSESSDLTRQALRMVVSDKSVWAQDAGCKAPSPPPLRPESILTDTGAAFKAPHFAMSALELTRDVDIGPAGKSHLRGMKERFFRRIKDQVMAYFTGTTMGDVVTRGDYDAMGRASLAVGDLGRELFRFINDDYNLTEHRGLKEQPPIDRFNEQYADYGAWEPASVEDTRIIFGIDVDLPVTRQGCWFAGNHYWSGKLGAHFRDHRTAMRHVNGTPMLRVKIDPLDLSRISAWIEGIWETLVAPSMERIGMSDWVDMCHSLKLRYGAQAAVHYNIVASARRDRERRGTEARLKANVIDMSYDSETIVKAANKIRIHFVERARPTEPGAMLAMDSSSREACFETGGNEALHAALPDLTDEDGASAVREETDLGLDDVDIDRDGDLIDDGEADASDAEDSPDEPVQPEPQQQRPSPNLLESLPKPIRKI